MSEQAPNPGLEQYADRPQNWAEADEDYQESKRISQQEGRNLESDPN